MGPLLNPAGREHIILGVYQDKYVPVIAETLFRLGTTKSLVFMVMVWMSLAAWIPYRLN